MKAEKCLKKNKKIKYITTPLKLYVADVEWCTKPVTRHKLTPKFNVSALLVDIRFSNGEMDKTAYIQLLCSCSTGARRICAFSWAHSKF